MGGDLRAVVPEFRRRAAGKDLVVDARHVLEQAADLQALPLELGRVVEVLVLAAAAFAEQGAAGLGTVG